MGAPKTVVSEVIAALTQGDVATKLRATRLIKNQVIGNKTRKIAYIENGAVPALVQLLTQHAEQDLLVQAAATIGSLACGSGSLITVIIEHGCTSALINCIEHPSQRVVEAAARSLNLLFKSAAADYQTPHLSENGIKALVQRIADAGKTSSVVDPFVSRDEIDAVAALCASALTRACLGMDPLKAEGFIHSVHLCGGIDATLTLLRVSNYPLWHESCLELLSAAAGVSREMARYIASSSCAIEQIIVHLSSSTPRARMLAASCMAHFGQADALGEDKGHIQMKALPIVIRLFSEQDVTLREQAPRVLATLIADNEELQRAAAEADSVPKLAAFLSDKSSSIRLRENCLVALAALGSLVEDSRRAVVSAGVVSHLSDFLAHPSMGVRHAAVTCCRSLSRSVRQMRSALVEAGLALPLFKLLDDPSLAVQMAASATICNIVLDFSPMKQIVVMNGGIKRLVELTSSENPVLRLNGVWALKNMLFRADLETKRAVMQELTYPRLLDLIQAKDAELRQQALTILRNLAYRDVALIFEGAPALELMAALSRVLTSDHVGTLTQALYSLCNMATGSEQHKAAVMQPEFIKRIFELTKHTQPEIRVAAVWCVINLTWSESPSACPNSAAPPSPSPSTLDPTEINRRARGRQLINMGFLTRLQHLLYDPHLDVRDRVRSALSNLRELE